MTEVLPIALREWESWEPTPHGPGWGVYLDDQLEIREVAERLTDGGVLSVIETRDGLAIGASSYVGRIKLGSVSITVRPKLQGLPLWVLMRYAFDLRALSRFSQAGYETEPETFQDILIMQLADEATELISRGLHRTYQARFEHLSSPRGRIVFGSLARRTHGAAASLPCRYHVRSEDCLENQVLRAGLRLAALQATDAELSVTCRRIDQQLGDGLSEVRLDRHIFARVGARKNRLTRAYRPALQLIAMLAGSRGLSLEGDQETTWLPGFLFDMNMFFQHLISRYLREHLPGLTVSEEHRLLGMMAYAPAFNPRNKRAPVLRPDFVIFGHGKAVALLDTKYRDLWERDLPREMLYQLAIYALSREPGASATILYPTLASEAREARIDIRDAVAGSGRSTVVLRPVHMLELSELVSAPDSHEVTQDRRRFAEGLCFGEQMAVVA
jgi:5-methylcytosine-specific restriction enzyme subunit McrC